MNKKQLLSIAAIAFTAIGLCLIRLAPAQGAGTANLSMVTPLPQPIPTPSIEKGNNPAGRANPYEKNKPLMSAHPDLVVTGIGFSGLSTGEMAVYIENIGAADAKACTVQVKVAETGKTINVAQPALAKGGKTKISLSIGQSIYEKTITATADVGNCNSESSETNNSFTKNGPSV